MTSCTEDSMLHLSNRNELASATTSSSLSTQPSRRATSPSIGSARTMLRTSVAIHLDDGRHHLEPTRFRPHGDQVLVADILVGPDRLARAVCIIYRELVTQKLVTLSEVLASGAEKRSELPIYIGVSVARINALQEGFLNVGPVDVYAAASAKPGSL